MAGIDRASLLAWLREKAKSKSLVGGAIYQGIHDRVQRGDFDEEDANGVTSGP